ncbi:hypothetical protein LCGC14_0429490 [marine sediment metagenome]|uniref:Uncharacterized protein n=1 Tax=marine sediment metagenome TaxID=412755 RepID=A0A0F9VXT1_9ZZZZ
MPKSPDANNPSVIGNIVFGPGVDKAFSIAYQETECRMQNHPPHEGSCKRSANPSRKDVMNYRACNCSGHGKVSPVD